MGKTTLMLFEAVHIALGQLLFGMEIKKPGHVLILTAEDSREMLVARLRAIAKELALSNSDLALMLERIRISDVSGDGFKLTEVIDNVVLPAPNIDEIIAQCRTLQPVLIVIDPAVSFGVGESRVNDAEQGLVEAARRLRRALNCCVQYIHHSGKQNAKDKAVDQYAGRGGSAFADGARMVHVLQSLSTKDWLEATGETLAPGESGLILARPKMSYCAPPGDILIRRRGYNFARVEPTSTSAGAKAAARADQLWNLIDSELKEGRFHTKNTLEHADAGAMTRPQIRAALALLEASGRVENRNRPDRSGKGGAYTYIHPIASPGSFGEATENQAENDDCLAPEIGFFASPPPIGNTTAANQSPPVDSSFFYGSPESNGEPMANPANQSASDVLADDGEEF
jgi:RecA-family ATPase